MGDGGKLYVSEELVEIYKQEVIPGADFLKPNQTECEYVTSLNFRFLQQCIFFSDIRAGI
jgi:pyridoxine kinase